MDGQFHGVKLGFSGAAGATRSSSFSTVQAHRNPTPGYRAWRREGVAGKALSSSDVFCANGRVYRFPASEPGAWLGDTTVALFQRKVNSSSRYLYTRPSRLTTQVGT